MITHSSFLKVVPVSFDSTNYWDSSTQVSRTVTTRIEDINTIAVYYNGQLIPGGTSPVTPSSKYYFEFSNTLDTEWPTRIGLSNPTPDHDTSSVVFRIKINPSFTAPGYTSGTSTDTFVSSDSFFITYYYVVYSVE